LCNLAVVGPGDISLVAEAESIIDTDSDSETKYSRNMSSIMEAYMQLGYVRKAWACAERLPKEDADGAKYHAFVSYYHGALPAWPEDMLGDAVGIVRDIAPMWSYDFLTQIAQQHPNHASRILDVMVNYPYESEESRQAGHHDHQLRGVVGVACGIPTRRKAMLGYARQVAEGIREDSVRLQAEISLIQATKGASAGHHLYRLKRRAEQQLGNDPEKLSDFLADLREHTQQGEFVSQDEEVAVAAAIADPFERAAQNLLLAKAYKDPELVQRALQSAGNLPDRKGTSSLASMTARTYPTIPGAALRAKPYILRLLNSSDDQMWMRNFKLGVLAEAIAKDGTPAEAQDILDIMDREDNAWPMAAAAIVRATAALGPNHYFEARRFAQRTATDDVGFQHANVAALAIGSCRYQTPNQVRGQLAKINYLRTKADALCEIALTSGQGEYLRDAYAAARVHDRFAVASGVVERLIHVIDSAGVMLGRPVKPSTRPGAYVHHWAFPSR
jgi:hypothetical protein